MAAKLNCPIAVLYFAHTFGPAVNPAEKLALPVVIPPPAPKPKPMLLNPVVIPPNVELPIAVLLVPDAVAANATSPIDMLLATLLVPLPTLTELMFKYGDVIVPSNVRSDSATIAPAPFEVKT